MKRLILSLICLTTFFNLSAQNLTDSITQSLMSHAMTIRDFGRTVPQEKVYLHFDNTSYYQGDKIWFQCYVVTADQNRLSNLSKTLYVELLTPEGNILQKRILPIINGRCNGNFELNQIPFHSGFYEIRAYTKYMTNFGDGTIFSRVFPVFDQPEKEGDFKKRKMMRMQNVNAQYRSRREMIFKNEKLNVKFYPEGGNSVLGINARMAFEATSSNGSPVDVEGKVVDKFGVEVATFKVNHEGRGVFDYTPTEGAKAKIEYAGKSYSFDMPEPLKEGFAMTVDNLSSADSIKIQVTKSKSLPNTMLGATLMSGGKLVGYTIVNCEGTKSTEFAISKKRLPAGVAQIVLADASGQIVADRLIFSSANLRRAKIEVKQNAETYNPHDAINLKFNVSNAAGRPLQTSLSLAVREGESFLESGNNILTDLLLMSEIKGYVHRPEYYFEADDEIHRQALDELLMVQGWRRYNWKWWAGVEKFDLKYIPEQGIEVHGKVLKVGSDEPMTEIMLSSLLTSRGDENYNSVKADIKAKAAARKTAEQNGQTIEEEQVSDENNAHMGVIEVDSTGNFEFIGNFNGKWNLVFAVTNDKNRAKSSRIILDRKFTPKPKTFTPSDMQVRMTEEERKAAELKAKAEKDALLDTVGGGLIAFTDPDEAKKDLEDRVHNIKEVVVTGEETPEQAKYNARSNAVIYYDVAAELDAIRDEGDNVTDLNVLLGRLNEDFIVTRANRMGGIVKSDSTNTFGAQGAGAFLEQGANFGANNSSITFTRQTTDEETGEEVSETITAEKAAGATSTIQKEWNVSYKGKEPLFIVDYERDYLLNVTQNELAKLINIKSIYVSEEVDAITKYANPDVYSHLEALNKYSCVVFIETYPVGQIPTEPKRGMRRTWVDGYSEPVEFYAPDYAILPKDVDYRRTLYWNPEINTDAEGRAEVEFYNNSRCKQIKVSAETISKDGSLGATM